MANYDTNKLPLRVLSLDGGGARGLVELQVLERIFNTPELKNTKPCDFFDLIVGTSTGGIVAVLLGRLELKVDEALQVYKNLIPIVFSQSIFNKAKMPHYDSKLLEREIKNILHQYDFDAENETLASVSNKCQVALVTRRGHAATGPMKLFRSYNIAHGEDDSTVPIWQCIRATSAAPTFFDPMTIKGVDYVDGGLLCNNPAIVALKEAKCLYPDRKVGILYSIGTGISKTTPALIRGWADFVGFAKDHMQKFLTSTEGAHNDAFERCDEMDIPYFRFDPPFVGDLAMDNPDLSRLNAWTQDYLSQAEQQDKLRKSHRISVKLNASAQLGNMVSDPLINLK